MRHVQILIANSWKSGASIKVPVKSIRWKLSCNSGIDFYYLCGRLVVNLIRDLDNKKINGGGVPQIFYRRGELMMNQNDIELAHETRIPDFPRDYIKLDSSFCRLNALSAVFSCISIYKYFFTFWSPLIIMGTICELGIFYWGLKGNKLLLKNDIAGIKFAYISISLTITKHLIGLVFIIISIIVFEPGWLIGISTKTIILIMCIALLIRYIVVIKQAKKCISLNP